MVRKITNRKAGVSTSIGGDTLLDSENTNRQAVDVKPSIEHQQDFTLILCELQKMNRHLEKMLLHFEVITDEDI